MKPSDFQKTVMCRFDSCLKKTVFGVVKDYYKELKKNQAEAIPFCELHIAKLNGRLCGAKRPHSVSEQPNFYQSLQSNPYNDSSHPSGGE